MQGSVSSITFETKKASLTLVKIYITLFFTNHANELLVEDGYALYQFQRKL